MIHFVLIISFQIVSSDSGVDKCFLSFFFLSLSLFCVESTHLINSFFWFRVLVVLIFSCLRWKQFVCGVVCVVAIIILNISKIIFSFIFSLAFSFILLSSPTIIFKPYQNNICLINFTKIITTQYEKKKKKKLCKERGEKTTP